MPAYHYTAIFPRRTDAPRQAWPIETIGRFRAIAGVVDVVYPDLAASWARAGAEDTEIRVETNRRFVEIFTSHASKKDAEQAEAEIRAALLELAGTVGATRLTITRCALEGLEEIQL